MGILTRVLEHWIGHNEVGKDYHDQLMSQLEQRSPLIRLQENRQALELTVLGQGNSFQTIILGIDLYSRQILLDEPVPRSKNIEDFVGQTVTIRHQRQQLELRFNATVIDYNPVDRSLIIDLPEHTDYEPRRLESRIQFGEQSAYSINVYPLFGAPWYSALKNISTGGMRIAVAGDLRSQLHKNLPIQRCDIGLDFQNPIRCRGRVKSFSFSSQPYRHTLISIMFEELSQKDRLLLEDFVNEVAVAA